MQFADGRIVQQVESEYVCTGRSVSHAPVLNVAAGRQGRNVPARDSSGHSISIMQHTDSVGKRISRLMTQRSRNSQFALPDVKQVPGG